MGSVLIACSLFFTDLKVLNDNETLHMTGAWASSPYKRWSKCSMEKSKGGDFCSLFQEIQGGS